MKDIGKQIIFIEKKKELITNDLFKQIALDLLDRVDNLVGEKEGVCLFGDKEKRLNFILEVEEIYTDQLHELRNSQKRKSRQMEIGDEQNESKGSN